LRDVRDGLRLRPGHHHVQFDFTAFSFGAPENVHFRYQLAGLDEKWIEAGPQRSVIYPRLPPGEYKFRVKACNSDGVWNENGATLAFIVTPFFWQHWWFQSAALIFFTTALIALVRYVSFRRLRLRLQVLQQQAALEKERSRIAKDIHDDLGGSLTEITLRLELALRDRALAEKAD